MAFSRGNRQIKISVEDLKTLLAFNYLVALMLIALGVVSFLSAQNLRNLSLSSSLADEQAQIHRSSAKVFYALSIPGFLGGVSWSSWILHHSKELEDLYG